MPAWSRRPRQPAWVKRRKKRGKKTKKKTRKKTSSKTKDSGTATHWLRELLKLLTGVQYPEDKYHYDPRHYSKDPEYKWSDPRTRAFKKEIPAPDVHYFNPPGDQPPHLGMRGGFHKRDDREGWVHVHAIDPGAD